MQYVPSIKQSGGIFEIFVPGIFLFINCLAALLIAFLNEIQAAKEILNSPALIAFSLILFTCFGYLLGMMLRLLKTSIPDNFSAWVNRNRKRYWRLDKDKMPKWATEKFPFIGWMGINVKNCLPPEAYQFYMQVWNERNLPEGNLRFFNYCKNILDKKDNPIMLEIMATEATMRFLSGMFYSLIASMLILALVLFVTEHGMQNWHFITFAIGLYAVCLRVITLNFRFYRCKETEILFDATYQNKELFLTQEQLKDQ